MKVAENNYNINAHLVDELILIFTGNTDDNHALCGTLPLVLLIENRGKKTHSTISFGCQQIKM